MFSNIIQIIRKT